MPGNAGAARYLYRELNPRDWRAELCEELTEILDDLLAREPNAVVRLGYDNIKSPELVAVLAAPPSPDAIAWLRPICDRLPGLNLVGDGIGCGNHYCEIDWTPQPRPGWLTRLKARLPSF